MCGIIGMYVTNESKINYKLKKIYENQKSRGRNGAGCVAMRNEKLLRYRNDDADRFFIDLNQVKKAKAKKGDYYLFHHRLPTSTENIAKANHPIRNEKKSIYLIHNGVVSNAEKLHKELIARGHKFETATEKECGIFEGSKRQQYVIRSFTDTEVLVHLIEEKWYECEDIKETMEYVCKHATGSYALAFLIRGQNKIFLFKHSNPIIIFKDKKENVYFASEFPNDDNNFTLIKELGYNELGYLDEKGYTEISTIKSPISSFNWESWKSYKNKKSNKKDSKDFISEEKRRFAIEEAVYFSLKGMDLEEAIYQVEFDWGMDFSKKMKKRTKKYLDKIDNHEDMKTGFINSFEKDNFGYVQQKYDYDDDCDIDSDTCYYCGEQLKDYDKGSLDSCGMGICRKCENEVVCGYIR